MAINEDNLGLIGKPASLHNVDSRTPTTLIEVETGEVSTFHINRVTSDGPPKKRKSVDFETIDVLAKKSFDTTEIDLSSEVVMRKIDFASESEQVLAGSGSIVSKKKVKLNQ